MRVDSLWSPTRAEQVTRTALRLARPLRTRRGLAVTGFVTGVVLVALVAGLIWWVPRRSHDDRVAAPPEWQRPPVSITALADRTGVNLVRVAVTGDGGLLDLRYKVVDPGKAAAIHDTRTPPAIVDQRTGLVFSELLMNHSHTGELKPAVTYYLVFTNVGNWVRRGDEVTVLLGDAQVENVIVQ